MRGVDDSAGLRRTRVFARRLLPSGQPDAIGSLNLVFLELTTSGYPAYMCLSPTLQVRTLFRHALTWVEVRMVRYSFPV